MLCALRCAVLPQALITVSNHVGSIDDPLITSALVPNEYLARPEASCLLACRLACP